MRIVSLTCSNTEIVCALGAAEMLVAVDDYSDFPAEVVAALPRVGPDLGIDVEAVAALRPDLVLASLTVPGHERIVERLEAAALPFIAPAPESLEDTYDDIREIGARIGRTDEAARLVAEMRDSMAALRGLGRAGSRSPSLLVEWWPKPVIAPGRRSWVHDLLEIAGARNPLGPEAVKSRPLTMEEVAALAPDGFVISWCGVDPAKYRPEVVASNPAWQSLPAIQNGRIFCVPEAHLGRPGPRLVEGAKALRAIVDTLH